MAQTWMEEHEAIKIRVVGIELSSLVQSMVILNKGADLYRISYPIFHNCPKGVSWRSLWKWKFSIPARHAFRSDEDQMESNTREQMS